MTAKKAELHPNNKHKNGYDFIELIRVVPGLAPFVTLNQYKNLSIDFHNPDAVKMLNKALLILHYQIVEWDIPPDYLCPPIPGRADYIHNMAELLGLYNDGRIPQGSHVKCLDIGVGANCIYPIIGCSEYGWSFVGTDTDNVALESAAKIKALNPVLKGLELRLQTDFKKILPGVLEKIERMDVIICNPPFHASSAEAMAGTRRKLKNLTGKKVTNPHLNFGGKQTELWCEGGEKKFITDMIEESQDYARNCFWFSALVSKEAHLNSLYYTLEKVAAMDVKILPMKQGHKSSRIIAWTFQKSFERSMWRNYWE